MKRLRACLENRDDELKETLSNEPPELEKEKRILVMPGPLSTIMALALMKRYDKGEDIVIQETPETDKYVPEVNIGSNVQTDTTKNPSKKNTATPQTLSMEMQMAFLDTVLDTVSQNNASNQADLQAGRERYRRYFVLTTRSGYQYLN